MKHVLSCRIQQLPCCRDVSIPDFKSAMHQWANTLTSSGQNMPFSLPIRTDKLADGFQVCRCLSCSLTEGSMHSPAHSAWMEPQPQEQPAVA